MARQNSVKSYQRKPVVFAVKSKAGTIELDVSSANVNATSNALTSAAHGLVTGDRILFTEDASPTALSLGTAAVTNASNLFTSAAHGFITGEAILVTEDNTLPSGLTTATTYYCIKIDVDTFKLASSVANAAAGTPVAISDDGTSVNSYDAVPAPGGLTSATQYWVVKVDADSFKLATTYANANAGTVIDILHIGAGSNEYDTVEEVDGLDKKKVALQASAVGTYVLTIDSSLGVPNDIVVVGNAAAADKAVSIHSISSNVITIKVNDIDETAALSDGLFHVMIMGSDTADRN